MEEERRKAALTEEDREDIANKVFHKFEQRFYVNVGRGVWQLVWRVLLLGLIALAAYGAGGQQLFKLGGH